MKFKLGDTVRVIKNHNDGLKIGDIGRVLEGFPDGILKFESRHNENTFFNVNYYDDYFELIKIEKIQNKRTKFEEILYECQNGDKIEWFCSQDEKWKDMPLPWQNMEFSLDILKNGSFRIKPKKEKVKKFLRRNRIKSS